VTATKVYNPLNAVSEKAWQAQIVQAARLLGWKVYHPWLSIKSTVGWPDLTLVRGDVLIMAELKREGRPVSPRQQEWLDALARVPGVRTFVWRPSDWAHVEKVLKGTEQ
jgi:hypothetical protein